MSRASRALSDLNNRFEYRRDRKETWSIMKGRGTLRGDCEDYALTLIWMMERESMTRFWWSLTRGKYVIWYCTHKGNGHVVLWHDGKWIDNIRRKWVRELPAQYDLRYPHWTPTIALKMALN